MFHTCKVTIRRKKPILCLENKFKLTNKIKQNQQTFFYDFKTCIYIRCAGHGNIRHNRIVFLVLPKLIEYDFVVFQTDLLSLLLLFHIK